jgi:hypothetical protein
MNGPGWSGVHRNPSPTRAEAASFPAAGRNEGGGRSAGAREVVLVLCFLPLLAGAGWWVALGADGVTSPPEWAALALGAAGWVSALLVGREVRDSFALLVVLASGAVALRLPFLASDSGLSDDVHRYIWEGALVGAGVDPYAAPPAAAELEPFRRRYAATFARVNHSEVRAAYPPLAQVVNAGVVAAAGGAEHPARARLYLRVFYAGCDLLACVPLGWLLARARQPRMRLVAWAWNPWVAFEFAGSAHLDALAILCLLGALACCARGSDARDAGGLAFLAAGTAIKLLPVALVPFVLRRARRPLLGMAFFTACLLVCALPFVLLTGKTPGLGGLGEYALGWESFSLLHRGVEPILARFLAFADTWSDPRRVARALELALWLGLAVQAWRRRLALERTAALLVGGFLVLSPTLHPWYLGWIVPFLALRLRASWCALVALAPLLYWPVDGWRERRVWEEPAWLFPLLGGVFWSLLVLELLRAFRPAR